MSHYKEIRVVETTYEDGDGATTVHIEGWGPLATPSMQAIAADGLDTYMVTSGVAWDVVDATKDAIKARIDAGESTPVLKSHLDALGITAAVESWASESD